MTEARTDISAPRNRVWSVLEDVTRWPEWTASIESVELLDGARELAVGVRARVRQPRLAPATWRVTALDPGRRFTWVSSVGGVTSTGMHVLADGPGGTTTFTNAVEQRGLLAPVVRLVFGRLVHRYLDLETQGLKRRCES